MEPFSAETKITRQYLYSLLAANFNLIENSVNNLMKQFSLGKYNSINDDSYAVREIISKDELMNAVTDLFKKYSIASK